MTIGSSRFAGVVTFDSLPIGEAMFEDIFKTLFLFHILLGLQRSPHPMLALLQVFDKVDFHRLISQATIEVFELVGL